MTTREAPVEIVPYDPSWPRLFEEERKKLLPAIGPWLAGPVEHIGSTAITGLAAKPVIDVALPHHHVQARRSCHDRAAPGLDCRGHRERYSHRWERRKK